MKLDNKEFKKRLESKTLGNSFLLIQYKDNSFLAFQYINYIVKNKGLNKNYIDDLQSVPTNSTNVFDVQENDVYIINVDKFTSSITNFSNYKNVIVVCRDVDKKTLDNIINSGTYVELVELEEWHIIEYINSLGTGLSSSQIKSLYEYSDGDIYKINNEIKKLSVFDKSTQSQIFNNIKSDGGYDYLGSNDLYTLTTALIKQDARTVAITMSNLDGTDLEAMSLIYAMTTKLKDVINVKLLVGSTSESLKMKPQKFAAIRDTYKNANSKLLSSMFEFISSFDFKLKTGQLQMSNERMLDYIICNILSL
jgi:DNA polymerase III delta subunit